MKTTTSHITTSENEQGFATKPAIIEAVVFGALFAAWFFTQLHK